MKRLTVKRIEEIELIISRCTGATLRFTETEALVGINLAFPGILQEMLNEIYALREEAMQQQPLISKLQTRIGNLRLALMQIVSIFWKQSRITFMDEVLEADQKEAE